MTGAGLLDYKEAATFTGLSEYTLRRFVSQHKIPSKVVGLKRRFFSKDELLSWIEQNTAKKAGKRSARTDERHA
jgi:excisionase family DNA binding protein